MTLIEIRAMKDLFKRELTRLESISIKCQSCENYTDRKCQKWEMVPPDEVLNVGCDSWEYDWIPF